MQPLDENIADPAVEQREANQEHELTDEGAQNEKIGASSLLQEIESGLGAAVEMSGNGGNPDTPGTMGSGGLGTPTNP